MQIISCTCIAYRYPWEGFNHCFITLRSLFSTPLEIPVKIRTVKALVSGSVSVATCRNIRLYENVKVKSLYGSLIGGCKQVQLSAYKSVFKSLGFHYRT